MMYSKFVEGTGCKQNDHNFRVFQNLEAMYMNTEMTKAEIYEYGKKLVDNSKSKAEIELENEIKANIAELKEEIEYYRDRIHTLETFISIESDKSWIVSWKREIKIMKEHIKEDRVKINGLKWVLES